MIEYFASDISPDSKVYFVADHESALAEKDYLIAELKHYRELEASKRAELFALRTEEKRVLERELAEAKRKVDEIKKHTWCAYCGYEILLEDPKATDKITEHVQSCPKHPMRAWERHAEALEEQNKIMIGDNQCLKEEIKDYEAANKSIREELKSLASENERLKGELSFERERADKGWRLHHALDGLSNVADILIKDGSVNGHLSLQGWVNIAKQVLKEANHES